MSQSESTIMKKIQLAASRAGILLFRNNTGAYKAQHGGYIRYGVGEKGGSDLIGLTKIKITHNMVGREVGVFTAIEVKSQSGRATKEQLNFIAAIKKQGGIAGIAHSEQDAEKLIKGYTHDNTDK